MRPWQKRWRLSRIPVEGQAIAHLVSTAALDGVICFGPDQDGKPTYALLADWVKQDLNAPYDENQALAELARRYFDAFGPASLSDFRSWCGLSAAQVKAGFEAVEADLLEVSIDNTAAWMPQAHADWLEQRSDQPVVSLLPRFDNYLLGYASRDFMVQEAYARRIHPGGGMFKQALLVNGEAVGTWRNERKKGRLRVIVEPFNPLPASFDALHRSRSAGHRALSGC